MSKLARVIVINVILIVVGVSVAVLVIRPGFIFERQTSKLVDVEGEPFIGDTVKIEIDGVIVERPWNQLFNLEDEWAVPYTLEFEESGQTRWVPYTYWRREPYSGEFINVDEQGIRQTTHHDNPEDQDVVRIYFYGGSTAWGSGARDSGTIPSFMADFLHESSIKAYIQNFGETGYVSRQDLILFQSQLLQGDIPDIAIFYHPWNDLIAAHLNGFIGIPQNETKRTRDFQLGRMIDRGEPLPEPLSSLRVLEWDNSIIHGDVALSAENTVSDYFQVQRLIRLIGEAYGVQTYFVSQPTPLHKNNLLFAEQRALEYWYVDQWNNLDYFREAYDLIEQTVRDNPWQDVIILHDVFADTEGLIFYDQIHVNELGNQIIARQLVDFIFERDSQ